MSVIWKFTLSFADEIVLALPTGAEVLTFQNQGGVPCLWVRCDPQATTTPRTFRIYGTGHPSRPGDETYIGSAQFEDGKLMFHLFETPTPW